MGRATQLIDDLNSPTFKVRETADKELEHLGFPVLPSLRQRLLDQPSLELKRRLERLIGAIEEQGDERRRELRRAIQLLETAQTPAALALLKRLDEEGHEPDMVRPALHRVLSRDKKLGQSETRTNRDEER
jgi:hypothetical protein